MESKTGSGEELSYFSEYCRRSKFNTDLCIKLYTYGLDGHWATTASTVKSNYFRFAKITLTFMCNELSNITDLQTVWLSFGWTLIELLHSPAKCYRWWYITTSGSTHSSTEYRRWRTMAGSDDNFTIFANIVDVQNPKQAYAIQPWT